jgi:hypothetical protein
LVAALLTTPFAWGQPGQPAQRRPQPTPASTQNAAPRNPDLVKFDLDFPGGTPRQLVEAIEKASGKPLNAVITDDDADLRLPPLKMRGVNVVELFRALSMASSKLIKIPGGTFSSSYGFGFDPSSGEFNDDTVWWFHHEKPVVAEPERSCCFYQLAPFLETYKVEDITTAIQTGWKMLGETNPPTITFHKDTKLLIAVGEQSKLHLIDSVLQNLAQGLPQPQREATGAKTAGPAKK